MAGRERRYDDKPGDEQRAQARMHWLYGRWLVREAAQAEALVVAAQPWPSLAERLLAAVI